MVFKAFLKHNYRCKLYSQINYITIKMKITYLFMILTVYTAHTTHTEKKNTWNSKMSELDIKTIYSLYRN